MNPRHLAIIIGLLLLCGPLFAQPNPNEGELAPQDTTKARGVLSFFREQYYLGENVLAHYGIINTGGVSIAITIGGDYRGAPRELRFRVTAVDAQGNAVEDAFTTLSSLGGRSGFSVVKPGSAYWRSVPLLRHLAFTQPGTYTIAVYHDLGWDPQLDLFRPGAGLPAGPHRAPIVQGTITLVMPTPEQARAVFTRALTLPADTGGTDGVQRSEFQEITALRYPVYLPLLEELARRGDPRGVDGLAAMATPEATEALLRLAETPLAGIDARVLEALLSRLPRTSGTVSNQRRGIPDRAWRDDLLSRARVLAWGRLARSDRQSLIDGARLLAGAGTPEDLPRLTTVLDRVLEMYKDDALEQRTYPQPATACGLLLAAADALHPRGGGAATTAGALAVALRALVNQPITARPVGWQELIARGLAHPIPVVRAAALAALPLAQVARWATPVTALIAESNPLVQAAALRAAAAAQLAPAGEAALALLATTRHEELVGEARATAQACGITDDRWAETCVRRLEEPGMATLMIEQLLVLCEPLNGRTGGVILPADAVRLKTRWTAFLTDQRRAIRAGTRFPLAQYPLTLDLLPTGWRLYTPTGKEWPPAE